MTDSRAGQARYTPATLPRVAALYVRVSSEAQAKEGKTSPQTQLAALRAKAAELGFATADESVYEDHHTGEELNERKALARLCEDARARRFGLVLAYNVYALAKNQAHLGILLDEWERLGIRLAFATEDLEDTPIGRAIRNMQAFAAEMEGERRKDRVQRARLARAESGKPVVGSRTNYGYVWAQERRPDGRLRHDRLEVNPPTAAVMVRMYEMADAGMTLRGIAATLTAEGVPTPTGKQDAWDASSIMRLLRDPIYKGEARTLRRRSVPVDKSVRHLYKRRTREVPRPEDEQIPLPSSFAPALVSAELWARVNEQLRRNKEMSARNNRDPHASILRGLVRCGHCGYRMTVINSRGKNGVSIRCQTGIGRLSQRDRCSSRGLMIAAHKLDDAVWAKVTYVLRHPAVITEAVERMRAAPTPGTDNLASTDERLAKIDQQIATIHKQVLKVDDEAARDRWAADEKLLWKERREVEAERAKASRDVDGWRILKYDLEQIVQEVMTGDKNPDEYTPEERRKTLLTFGVEALVYRAGHTPRARMVLRLPLSRALALDLRLGEGEGATDTGLMGAYSVDSIKDLVTV